MTDETQHDLSRRQQIIELARCRYEGGDHHADGDINVDGDAVLEEDEDENGAYVSAWVWLPFTGTQWDKTARSDGT
jgi:hypothetical protein